MVHQFNSQRVLFLKLFFSSSNPPSDCPAHIVIIIIISSAAGELVSDEVLVNLFSQSYIHRHLMITILIIRLLLARYYLQCCFIIRY